GATTKNGGNWLAVTPTSGHLEPGATENVTVNVTLGTLSPSSYQGTLTFTSAEINGPVAVSVTLTVSTPPVAAIGVQSSGLNFTAVQGSNPGPQTFTVTDTGTATLHWITS